MLRGNLVALQKNEAFIEQSLISLFFSHIRNDLQKQGIANNHSLFVSQTITFSENNAQTRENVVLPYFFI